MEIAHPASPLLFEGWQEVEREPFHLSRDFIAEEHLGQHAMLTGPVSSEPDSDSRCGICTECAPIHAASGAFYGAVSGPRFQARLPVLPLGNVYGTISPRRTTRNRPIRAYLGLVSGRAGGTAAFSIDSAYGVSQEGVAHIPSGATCWTVLEFG